MSSWAEAHRVGLAAALRTHRDLGLSPQERVPVFQAADQLGLRTLFKPMPRLAGVYVREPGLPPGMQVNTRFPAAKQRYTAAHEIGHHVLDHASTFDLDTELKPGNSAVPDHEKTAEAFAAWFLMPRQLVNAVLANRPLSGPVDIYQLSLRLGTSYEATCRQLVNLRRLSQGQCDRHLKVRPQDIKVSLANKPPVGIGRNDVHVVERVDAGATVHASPNDLVIIRAGVADPERFAVNPGSLAAPEDNGPVGDLQGQVLRYRTVGLQPANPAHPAPVCEVVVVDESEWSFRLVVEPPRKGISERWF